MKPKYSKQIMLTLLILSAFLNTFSLQGQSFKPESAQRILEAAVANAQLSNKNIFLIFHATWCGWCRRLEAALNDTAIKPIIDANFVVTALDVMERGDKIQTVENSGGQQAMSDFGGSNAGLPFFVFLDEKGKMIANSNVMPEKQNIGYPGSKEEITEFMTLLKQTAPQLTGNQRQLIQKYFELHAPKD